MVFAGLPLLQLLLIAGGAASVTVLLYILKLRRRAVPVPFARIWDAVFRDRQATELFSRLRRLLSLLFQLALLALLIFALGDPRPKQSLLEGRHLVVLVDGSASMKAVDVKPNRIEAAKAEVKKLVRGLGSADRALIVQMGALSSPLSTMTSDVTELDPAIDSLSASDTRADLERGLSFAIDSLRGLPKAEVVVVSDGVLGDVAQIAQRIDLGGASLKFLPIGNSGTNVAISEFSVRRYPLDKSRSEVMLEVANTNDRAAQVELTLLGDGTIIDVSRFALGPNERLPRYYQDLAGASRTLEAKIRFADGRADDLPADDHAYALMPERHRARVLVISKGNTYLEAALLLDEYLDVTTVVPGQALAERALRRRDLGRRGRRAAGHGGCSALSQSAGRRGAAQAGRSIDRLRLRHLGQKELDIAVFSAGRRAGGGRSSAHPGRRRSRARRERPRSDLGFRRAFGASLRGARLRSAQ